MLGIIREKVQAYPGDPRLIQKLYDAVTWRLAMDMRLGTTFQAAIKTIKDDVNWLAEQVRKYQKDDATPWRKPPKGRGRSRTRSRSYGRGNRKPNNKKRGKGKKRKGKTTGSPQTPEDQIGRSDFVGYVRITTKANVRTHVQLVSDISVRSAGWAIMRPSIAEPAIRDSTGPHAPVRYPTRPTMTTFLQPPTHHYLTVSFLHPCHVTS